MDSECDYSFKIAVVGDGRVGKTSLISRFVDDSYTDDYERTISHNCKLKMMDLDDKRIRLELWDIPYNSEEYHDIPYVGEVDGFIIVYDSTNLDSYNNVGCWFEKSRNYSDNEGQLRLLLGNKCDRAAEKVVNYSDAKEYANPLGTPCLETSAENATNVSHAFMRLVSMIKHRFEFISLPAPSNEVPQIKRLSSAVVKFDDVKEPGEEVILNHRENKYLHQMNEMRKQKKLCDVNFMIKDRDFPCHKIVLMNPTLDSEYFRTLFTSNFSERDSDTIMLLDVEPEAMEEILSSIYTARFHLNRRNAYFILRASHMFLLMDIFNAAVSCIMKNLCIDYLIETCLFAKMVGRDNLHQRCISAIAADLSNSSKTDSFNEEITFELFKMMLKHKNLIDDKEAVFWVIMRWSNHNKTTDDEVFQLLDIVNLGTDWLNTHAMGKWIVDSLTKTNNEIPFYGAENPNHQSPEANVCYEVYLNTVDVKSGAKGWAILQSKLESNECKIISYEQSNSLHRKVEKIGNKLYCFEYDMNSKKIMFYCNENGEKTYLASPWSLNDSVDTEYYDIEVLGNSIYLITNSGELWRFDCEINSWKELPIQHQQESLLEITRNKIISKSPRLISCDGELFVVGIWGREPFTVIPNQSLSAQYFKKCPREFTNPAVCYYDNKVVICGSDHDKNLHNIVSVYDTIAQNWYNLENMKIGRAGHILNCHNGFLYAIENKSVVPNEKYDIKLNEWTYIPSFPKRVNFSQENIILATGSVFNCSMK